MLKAIQKEVENLRIKVYSGLSTEDTDTVLYEIEQMLFKAMDEQLILPIVSKLQGTVCKQKGCKHRHVNEFDGYCLKHYSQPAN